MVIEELNKIKKEIDNFYNYEEKETSYISEDEANRQISDFIEKLFN